MGKINKIFVTGAAGFIGFNLCKKLIDKNLEIIGFDNINNYYDQSLKKNRLKELSKISKQTSSTWKFIKGDLENKDLLCKIFEEESPEIVINLAAQAGVRYSIINPDSYIKSNIVGMLNILEICRKINVKNFIFASSSSVYGGNKKIPFNENDPVNHPVSLYAATKRSNELMAHCYSHLYNIPCTGLRFFTVYGPWGRPDMAPMIFTKAILENKPIKVFNNGEMFRDFTYIDDVVETIFRLINKPARDNSNFDKNLPLPSSSWGPFRILNIGNNKKIKLMKFINILEEEIGKKAIINFEKFQPGDVQTTLCDNESIFNLTGYRPETSLEVGIKKFVSWYIKYYKIS